MGIVSKRPEDDDELPGSGRRVDLGVKICPNCRREALPWEERCATCDIAPVAPDEVPATEISLPPGLRGLDDVDDGEDADRTGPDGTDAG